jgi:hypothetical protein
MCDFAKINRNHPGLLYVISVGVIAKDAPEMIDRLSARLLPPQLAHDVLLPGAGLLNPGRDIGDEVGDGAADEYESMFHPHHSQ